MPEWTAASLFSGIGGFELGLARAGVPTVASVEIDPMARGVLMHRFPEMTLFDDVQKVTADDLIRAGFNPERGIVTAGFPCQDVSLAGKRAGLAGARSGLFFEIIRILRDLQPRWFLLENVPGLLTSNDGRDMGTVVGELVELGYGSSWRVLDAQYFGVPQRRRRVFVAGCLGDPAGAGEVLLEPESFAGHPAAGGEKRAPAPGALANGSARGGRTGGLLAERGVVQALTSSLGSGGPDAAHAQAGWLIPEVHPYPEDVANTLTSRYRKGVNTTVDDGGLAISFRKSKRARNPEDDETWVNEDHTNTLNCFDVGETRATQLLTYALQPSPPAGPGGLTAHEVKVSPSLTSSQLARGSDRGLRVVSPTGEVSHTLTAEGFDASEDGTGRGWPTVAFALRGRDEGIRPEIHDDGQTVSTLRAASGGSSKDYLAGEWGVRRLTPLECERLQGFPDGHTAQRVKHDKKTDSFTGKVIDQSDSARGHQIGNAVAVPVVAWIADRIVTLDAA